MLSSKRQLRIAEAVRLRTWYKIFTLSAGAILIIPITRYVVSMFESV